MTIKILAVIPARLYSSRFPRKVLANIDGKPMLWHVWQRASQAGMISNVVVATDSEEVMLAVDSWGGKAVMTNQECRSGTERIASVLDELEGDLIINIQGDEPLIDPELLDTLISSWQSEPVDMITPVYRIDQHGDLVNPNIVKVVMSNHGQALYFSRSPIPYMRDVDEKEWLTKHAYWGHIGVYGYRRAVLENYDNIPAGALEQVEKLEQLRFVEAGYEIRVVETEYRPVAVDTPEDLERVRHLMKLKSS